MATPHLCVINVKRESAMNVDVVDELEHFLCGPCEDTGEVVLEAGLDLHLSRSHTAKPASSRSYTYKMINQQG